MSSPPADSSKQHEPIVPHDDHSHDSHAVDGHAGEGDHKVERYPVTTVDFGRVETPFIIGIWILFASIAKIGE